MRIEWSPGLTRAASKALTRRLCRVDRYFSSPLIAYLFVKVMVTLFVVYFYSKLTTFSDASYYLGQQVNTLGEIARNYYTFLVFSSLRSVLGSDVAVHLFASLASGAIIWGAVRPYYLLIPRHLFWTAVSLPHFLVWSGYTGKEVITIAVFTWIVRLNADLVFGLKVRYVWYVLLISIALAYRWHYSLPYLWVSVVALLVARTGFARFKVGAAGAALGLLLASAVPAALWSLPRIMAGIDGAASTARTYFVGAGRSTRDYLDLTSVADLVANIWWGLPASIIGPLPGELLERPLFFVVFLEGLFSVSLLIYLMSRTLKCSAPWNDLSVFCWIGILPAVIMALLIHYPFGVYNPGSAIRYKQSLAPLFYVLPILLLGLFRYRTSTVPRTSIGGEASLPPPRHRVPARTPQARTRNCRWESSSGLFRSGQATRKIGRRGEDTEAEQS